MPNLTTQTTTNNHKFFFRINYSLEQQQYLYSTYCHTFFYCSYFYFLQIRIGTHTRDGGNSVFLKYIIILQFLLIGINIKSDILTLFIKITIGYFWILSNASLSNMHILVY